MPASFSDVLFAKLAMQQSLVKSEHLADCLTAQEAGKRAGVEQPLSQVLVKRGYMSHKVMNQLEIARELAERSRCAKLTVQLLLRHGRPSEEILRVQYGQLKQNGFPVTLAATLRSEGHLSDREHEALEQAVKRAWDALYHREAKELHDQLQLDATTRAGLGFPATAAGTSPGRPAYATAERAAYAPMGAPASGGYAAPGYGSSQPYGAPQAPGSGPHRLPPSPSPWQNTAERRAYAPEGAYGAPPGYPAAPQLAAASAPPAPFGAAPSSPPASPGGARYAKATVERVAGMGMLPEWARTRERSAFQEAPPGAPPTETAGQPVEAAPPPPGPLAADSNRSRKLAEATASVPGYEQIERIGRGTVGVVYKAKELASGRTVALKVLLPIFMENHTLTERFVREAAIAEQLDHPNIRKVFAGGQAGGLLYLAMEFVDGETLQDKIDRHGKLGEEESLRCIAQVARAMDHYNRKKILHRDVKPANILVARDGRSLLCDLGISKRVYEDYALTKQGTTLGSPWYLSPEQGMGTADLDIRSDIYSLGITLFHALTGRVPFMGGNAGVIISKHAREPLPDMRRINPKLSPQTVELVEKMCAKEPEKRHESPRQLLAEIAWIRTEVCGGTNTPVGPLNPPAAPDEEEIVPEAPKLGFFKRMLRAIGVA